MNLIDFLKWLKEQVALHHWYDEKQDFSVPKRDLVLQLARVMKRWPKSEGRVAHPVPHPDQHPQWNGDQRAEKACDAYYGLPRWQGEYGELRMELLDWLIGELSDGAS